MKIPPEIACQLRPFERLIFGLRYKGMQAIGLCEEDLEWIGAACDYDSGDNRRLTSCLRRKREVKDNVRELLISIMSGERKPNPRSTAKIKGDVCLRSFGICNYVMTCHGLQDMRENIQDYADFARKEPSQLLDLCSVLRTVAREEVMLVTGLKKAKIDQLAADFNRRIKKYPTL